MVHPNKLAKGGNFDCALMSLSVLLDYHPEDTKERFFEVSLFAEIFNEMLMRDFAFNIYKEIYLHNEKLQNSDDNADGGGEAKSETEKTPETNGSGEEKVTKDAAPVDESKIRKRRMSTVDGREQDNGGDRKAPPPKRRMSTIDGRDGLLSSSEDNKVAKPQRRMSIAERRESDLANETSSKKMVVVKPHLRLSFLYFDTTQCGYFFERDLEDLFAVLGLNLSRSQIKKVLGKLGTRLSIHYR